jgi:hypothetical protein
MIGIHHLIGLRRQCALKLFFCRFASVFSNLDRAIEGSSRDVFAATQKMRIIVRKHCLWCLAVRGWRMQAAELSAHSVSRTW